MAKKKDDRKFKSELIRKTVLFAEQAFGASCITFASQFDNPKGLIEPGGMCSCCGAGPRVDDEREWWLIMKAGLSDSDGVFYSMLCVGCDSTGCLEEIRAANKKRPSTFRDEASTLIMEMMGDDVDGAEAMMEDFGYLGMLDPDEEE